MALLHLTTSDTGLRLEGAPRRAVDGVMEALGQAPAGAPVAILIHGFMFDPSPEGRAAGRDPHTLLFGMDAPPGARLCNNWPASLGFSAASARGGLCIGFGWPAYATQLLSLAVKRRNSLAEAYHRAGEAGATLGALIGAMHAVRPDLRFDIFAHSLGARVALAAIGAPGVGRVLLLGGAEYAAVAEARLEAAGRAMVYNFVSRQNDPFDKIFEWLTKPPQGLAAGRASGALGCGLGGRRNWIDLQLDNPRLERWLARRGLPLGPSQTPICHWSFYTRRGVMDLFRTLLRDRESWSIAALRAGGAPEEVAPRWSRILPRTFGPPDLGRATTA